MLAVIDDDPTGAQAEAGVPLILEWTPATLRRIAELRPRAFHVLTNSRALEPDAAYRTVRSAAEAVGPAILRGDSTLRAHVLEEYLGLRDAVHGGRDAALLLVPALPAAGRVTRGGVHRLGDTPLHETEYARDGGFAYGSARLLEWAEERSGGFFPAARGGELHELSPEAVAEGLARAAENAPAVFAPDAASDADLDVIAAGLRMTGAPVIVRCAPAFVGRLARTTATDLVPAPRSQRGLLVACGSHVPTTTRQLARLVERRPESLLEVPTAVLADGAVGPAVNAAAERLTRHGVAIVATPRELDARGLAYGSRIAAGLARIVAGLRTRADVVLSKGGITSAVNLRAGLGAVEADVIGPLAAGISLWRATTPEGARMAYVVFPGNVGEDDALADIVDALAPAA